MMRKPVMEGLHLGDTKDIATHLQVGTMAQIKTNEGLNYPVEMGTGKGRF